MKSHRRRLTGLFGITALMIAFQGSVLSRGQQPATSSRKPTAASQSTPPYPDNIRPQAHYPQHRRSIVQHYPYPYPGYYQGDDSAGFRNPGGVGRHAEYYPAGGGQSQLEREHVAAAPPVARFDTNPDTNRQEQIQATEVGVQRYYSIQNHIDRMALPTWGYGFGVGGFGGFW
jgi:hypothetical protein